MVEVYALLVILTLPLFYFIILFFFHFSLLFVCFFRLYIFSMGIWGQVDHSTSCVCLSCVFCRKRDECCRVWIPQVFESCIILLYTLEYVVMKTPEWKFVFCLFVFFFFSVSLWPKEKETKNYAPLVNILWNFFVLLRLSIATFKHLGPSFTSYWFILPMKISANGIQ